MPLPQPLHIFRKDLRHLWPETLVVVLLFVAFVWAAPSRWLDSPYAGYAPFIAGFIKFLMPISWLIVISRLIHDEPLVGDRQFWTSRPYHWATLLAAKLLYIVAFLYLPFLLMQVYLLKHAGLYPTLVIPGLLHNLLLLTVIIVIPLTAIAAVTSTFARMLLSVLGGLIYLVVLTVLFGFLSFQRMAPPALKPIVYGLFIALPAIALVYQYARRRTLTNRLLLAFTPVIIFLLLLITPATALIHSAYPVFTGSNLPRLGEVPQQFASPGPQPGKLFTLRNEAILSLPASVTGLPEREFYQIDGTSLRFDQPGGHKYDGPYFSAGGQGGQIAGPVAMVSFPFPADTLARLKGTPTDVHYSLAAEHFAVGDPQLWHATLLPFAVPGHGICSYPPDDPNAMPTCRYGFALPENMIVSAPLAVNSCAAQPGQPAQQVAGRQRLQPSPLSLLGVDFDPVITEELKLRPAQQIPPGVNLLLCPGTSLSFIEAKSQGKGRFEFDQKQVVLENYAIHVPPQNMQQPGPPPTE